MVSFPGSVHVSKKVRRLLRIKQFDVTFDTAFDAVIKAAPNLVRGAGAPHLDQALYEAGYAHSVEVWNRQDNWPEDFMA